MYILDMKKILIVLTFITSLGIVIMFSLFGNKAQAEIADNVYGFSFKELASGEDLPLKKFEGKVMLIVNTASKCGFTKQYDGLEKLYKTYSDQGLVIIGVPSNDFGGQEPADNAEIAEFCKLNYGVSFPMAEKVAVSGDNAHPFYSYAKKKLGFGTAPKWNFHKYLVAKNGELIDHFNSTTSPDASNIVEAIEAELAK